MPDFLTTLAQRTLKTVPVIQPMITPLYAASFTEAAAPVEQEKWEEPAHTLKQAKPDPTPHKPRATVPPTSAHTEEVPLNAPHNGKFFGKSEGENGAKVGVRGGVERGEGLGLTLAESIESTEITGITGTDSIPAQGKPKALAPLHASPYPYFGDHQSFPSAKNPIPGSLDAQPDEPPVQE